MKKPLVMLLAGGVGSRLNILGFERAKPAVPFGGVYRIIDFTMSNVMNSGLDMVGVLTQYKPLSLMEHIGTGAAWDFIGRSRGAKILPPRTGQKDSDWYRGTADAVRQNVDFIESHGAEQILILSGDHIYQLDYSRLIDFHNAHKADLTIGMMHVPWEDTVHFGIAVTDEEKRVVQWEEKPQKAYSNLASMGIYLFSTRYLLSMLRSHPEHDFGKNIIPAAIESRRVFAFPFNGYWRDVGTIKAYWEANMDLLDASSGLDLSAWGMRTNIEEEGRLGDRPPAFIAPGSTVKNSVLSPGCVVRGHVEDSILSPGVSVGQGTRIVGSVIMHDCSVHRDALISRSILDKDVTVQHLTQIGVGKVDVPNEEKPDHLDCGLNLVGKSAIIPSNMIIGRNCILHPNLKPSDFSSQRVPSGATIRAA